MAGGEHMGLQEDLDDALRRGYTHKAYRLQQQLDAESAPSEEESADKKPAKKTAAKKTAKKTAKKSTANK